ncbi:N-acyl homoserine lactone hydrolase [Palleronia marisminoris]|uniref:N-acyl homoserine lactonase family protein n=1 Tax=Palleronia marisminoris TaxID=315423 RepID=UPI0008F28D26|nr:N-acyl homoserine lactonase family protein [Palleronia marisminoris]SFH27197.1 N-acyl homoserine lactone hydrolase [Palleronia marisminoris]
MMNLDLLKGRPARLTVLDFGLFRVHAGPRDIGICGFLLTTDADEHVLVDSGFPVKYAEDPARATKEDALGSFGEVLSITSDNMPAPQLAKAGVAPDQIDLFILTHTHIDHLGGLFDFAHAPMLISQAERALPKPLYWTGGQPWDWPLRDYVIAAEDAVVGPGLTLLQAPGHALGQIALLVELPETGPVLLASDAISRPSEIDERFDTAWNPAQAIESADRLMRIAAERDAFVIYGHDPTQWPDLRKSPDHYA